ncbi:hypothetical protein BLNAU_20527 [Blattamonas nauphoetae]|uniref:Uncharacterized protein n=1 Tax=Blattamonas nauphoetae TaxID=2049346 RepID=A0ABQ9WYH4_9EUKA|nr:hypothetical protein BLNAU_20527 [Blattamonas nauphoetae]
MEISSCNFSSIASNLGIGAAIHAIFQPPPSFTISTSSQKVEQDTASANDPTVNARFVCFSREGAYSGVYIAGYHVCVVAMGVLYGNVYASNPLLSVKVTDSLTITNVAFSDSSLLTAPTLLSVVSGGTVTANSLSLLSLSSVNISYISVPTCKYTGSLSTHLLSIQLNAATTAQVNVGSITFNVLSAQTRSRPTSISPSQERRVCRFNLSYDNSPFRHILIVTALFTVPANNLIVTQATISSPLLESDTMITPFAIVSGGTAKQTNVVLDGSVLAARFAHSMLIQTGGSLSLNSCTFNSITTSDEGAAVQANLLTGETLSSALTILKPAPLPTTKAATHTHTNGAFDIPSGTLTLKSLGFTGQNTNLAFYFETVTAQKQRRSYCRIQWGIPSNTPAKESDILVSTEWSSGHVMQYHMHFNNWEVKCSVPLVDVHSIKQLCFGPVRNLHSVNWLDCKH